MKSRKIQKSGTTHYLYLPASWCREHDITTDSTVYLEQSSNGELVVKPEQSEVNLASLHVDLQSNNPDLINTTIIACYINPIKEFTIGLKHELDPDQILEHKDILGGIELVDFDDKTIRCQTSLSLSDPDTILATMLSKIINITKLMQRDPNHPLIERYEQEIDKSNLLIHKFVISGLMYRTESSLKHVELLYINILSRCLEQITDELITLQDQDMIIAMEEYMKTLRSLLAQHAQAQLNSFVETIAQKQNREVNDIKSYKIRRIYSLLQTIAETMCDWFITDKVDQQSK